MDENQNRIRTAIHEDKVEIAKKLLQEEKDIRVKQDLYLRAAYEREKKEITEFIIELGNYEKVDRNLALIAYAAVGNHKKVQKLIDNGADPLYANDTACCLACKGGHTKLVKLLLKHGAYPGAQNSWGLQQAAVNDKLEVIEFLAKEMPDLHQRTENPYLVGAAAYGRLRILKYAIEVLHASVHQKKDEIITYAARNNQKEIVYYIIEIGGFSTPRERNILLDAMCGIGETEEVKNLLEAGADPHRGGHVCLTWAAQNGHSDIVRLLLKQGIHPRVQQDQALKNALLNQQQETACILLETYDELQLQRLIKEEKEKKENSNFEPFQIEVMRRNTQKSKKVREQQPHLEI